MFGYNVINGNSLVFYVLNGQVILIFVAMLIGVDILYIACTYLWRMVVAHDSSRGTTKSNLNKYYAD